MGGWALIDFANADPMNGAGGEHGEFGAYTTGLHACLPILLYWVDADDVAGSKAALCHMDSQARLGDLARGLVDWLEDGGVGGSFHILTTDVNDARVVACADRINEVIAEAPTLRAAGVGGESFGVRILEEGVQAGDVEGNGAAQLLESGRRWQVVGVEDIGNMAAQNNADLLLDAANQRGEQFELREANLGRGIDEDGNPLDGAPPLGERPGYITFMDNDYYLPPEPATRAPAAMIEAPENGGQGGGEGGGGGGEGGVPDPAGEVDPPPEEAVHPEGGGE
jgi:hypothetical protein